MKTTSLVAAIVGAAAVGGVVYMVAKPSTATAAAKSSKSGGSALSPNLGNAVLAQALADYLVGPTAITPTDTQLLTGIANGTNPISGFDQTIVSNMKKAATTYVNNPLVNEVGNPAAFTAAVAFLNAATAAGVAGPPPGLGRAWNHATRLLSV